MSSGLNHKPPSAHGDVLIDPPFPDWANLLTGNAAAATRWPAGMREARAQARAEITLAAEKYSCSMGLGSMPVPEGALIALTGHQPEFVHPGVWAKTFLLERLTRETGAYGINLVVDTDVATRVALRAPCMTPDVSVCEVPLAEPVRGATWVQSPVPGTDERMAFRKEGAEILQALPVTGFTERFSSFCDALEGAAEIATDLGTLITAARRSYEAGAGSTYRELPVSVLARSRAFRRFAAEILLDSEAFRAAMNTALGEYRVRSHTRSAAQPFPDLDEVDGRMEAPFWLLRDGTRLPVSVDAGGRLFAGDEEVLQLPASVGEAAAVLGRHELLLAPRALSLTLFARLFLGDLFIHGTGGGRYDQITDAVIEQYYGVEAPAYCVASMSLLLPLGVAPTTDEDVAIAERRFKRFEHNPDELLGQAVFLSHEERERLEQLSERKASLIDALAAQGADRKTLGLEVRMVNTALVDALRPLGQEIRADIERVQAAREAWSVLGDRTYPFFLWDPLEVRAMVW